MHDLPTKHVLQVCEGINRHMRFGILQKLSTSNIACSLFAANTATYKKSTASQGMFTYLNFY